MPTAQAIKETNETPGLACITVNCCNPAQHRGVCKQCYGRCGHLVRKGIETWESLEQSGAVLPVRQFRQVRRCGMDACDRTHYGRGYCRKCFAAAQRAERAGLGELESFLKLGHFPEGTPPARKYNTGKPRTCSYRDDPAEITERTAMVRAERIASEATQPIPGNTIDSAREWERWFFRRWDQYLRTRIGSTEARTALDAVLVRGKGV